MITQCRNALQDHFGFSLGATHKWGDCNRGFTIEYQFDNCDDMPDVTAENTGLSRPELVPKVTQVRHGGIWVKNIPGNYLRQRTKDLKISVHDPVLNIPVSCGDPDGSHCDYSYHSQGIPKVLSVSPAQFDGTSTLTLVMCFETALEISNFLSHVNF